MLEIVDYAIHKSGTVVNVDITILNTGSEEHTGGWDIQTSSGVWSSEPITIPAGEQRTFESGYGIGSYGTYIITLNTFSGTTGGDSVSEEVILSPLFLENVDATHEGGGQVDVRAAIGNYEQSESKGTTVEYVLGGSTKEISTDPIPGNGIDYTATFDGVSDGDYTAEVTLLGEGAFGTDVVGVNTEAPPSYDLSRTVASSPNPGEVKVEFTVHNVGDLQGEVTVSVSEKSGEFEDSKTLSINGNDTVFDSILFTGVSGGEYTMVVNVSGNSMQDTVVVEEGTSGSPKENESGSASNGILLAAGIGGVALVTLLASRKSRD